MGVVCLGAVLGPIAIYLALDARREIAASPGMRGIGKANAALLLGAFDVAVFAFFIAKHVFTAVSREPVP